MKTVSHAKMNPIAIANPNVTERSRFEGNSAAVT